MSDLSQRAYRAHWWDQAAKLSLLLGLLLPMTVAAFLLQQGYGARGDIFFLGCWFFLNVFLLFKTLSLRLASLAYQEHDPRHHRIRARARIYTVLSTILTVPFLILVGLALVAMIT